jgi:transcriptional regulator with XRE-family HTH domain
VAKSKLPIELRELGDNIRRMRTSLKLSQERLAELAEVNPRTLRRIEAGEINILVTTLARVCGALGCDWDNLVPSTWRKATKR